MKGRGFPHTARGSGAFEATWQLYVHSGAVTPAPVTDLECAQHLGSSDKEQDMMSTLSIWTQSSAIGVQ